MYRACTASSAAFIATGFLQRAQLRQTALADLQQPDKPEPKTSRSQSQSVSASVSTGQNPDRGRSQPSQQSAGSGSKDSESAEKRQLLSVPTKKGFIRHRDNSQTFSDKSPTKADMSMSATFDPKPSSADPDSITVCDPTNPPTPTNTSDAIANTHSTSNGSSTLAASSSPTIAKASGSGSGSSHTILNVSGSNPNVAIVLSRSCDNDDDQCCFHSSCSNSNASVGSRDQEDPNVSSGLDFDPDSTVGAKIGQRRPKLDSTKILMSQLSNKTPSPTSSSSWSLRI